MRINETHIRRLVRENLSSLLTEGPGAGYYVSMEGLKATNVHITGYEESEQGGKQIDFKAQIAPSIVEWKAEGYYDAVTSEGIYYDGDMVEEFGDEEKTVNGGFITGYVLEDEVMDYYGNGNERLKLKEVVDFINWKLDGFKFKTLVGSGYVHTNLSDPMEFEGLEIVSDNDSYGSEAIYIQVLELQAPNISNVINWFFENCYKFDEIFGANGEEGEEEMINESENYLTADQLIGKIKDAAEKANAVREDGMPTPEFVDQYLSTNINVEPGYSFIPLSDDYTMDDLFEVCDDAVDSYYEWKEERDSYFDSYMYENKNRNNAIKINESNIRKIVRKTLNELKSDTLLSAGRKAQKWREEHPFKYDRNRGEVFDRAAEKALRREHGIENKDISNYGGEEGNINIRVHHGIPEISGSRRHNFGDEPGPLGINHDVYHLSKKYGKDGNYGRTRMWDIAHETTPEEFFGNEEMGRKYREAEKAIEDYNASLNESKIRRVVRNTLKRLMFEEIVGAKTLQINDLDIDRVKIVNVNGTTCQFIATITPQPLCTWSTDDDEADTDIISGAIEGTIDLSQIKGAIDKRQGIQRNVIEKYIKRLFGYFNISGNVQSLDNPTVVFTDGIQIDGDNDVTAVVNISMVQIQTSGFNSEGTEYNVEDEYYDDTEDEMPVNEPQEEMPAEPEPENEPEPAMAEPEPEQGEGDINSILKQGGFYLKDDPKSDTTMRIYTNDNQWIGTYFPNDKRAMNFADIQDKALIANLKQACENAGIRFLPQ